MSTLSATGLVISPSHTIAIEGESPRSNLKKIPSCFNRLYRYSITSTGLLPFSSRGVVRNILLCPFVLPWRLATSKAPDCSQRFKEYVAKDWNAGISDFYIDLTKDEILKQHGTAVHENIHYAAYLANTFNHPDEDVSQGIVITPKINTEDAQLKEIYRSFDVHLKKMGFYHSISGDYYHKATGTIFNLVYVETKQEIIMSFPGLGSSENIPQMDWEMQEDISKEGARAATADWCGIIPPATLQAIKQGGH